MERAGSKPSWLYIEPDLTLWKNLQLRFWLLGMDLFSPFYWRWKWWRRGAVIYEHCLVSAADLSYGQAPPGPHAPFPD